MERGVINKASLSYTQDKQGQLAFPVFAYSVLIISENLTHTVGNAIFCDVIHLLILFILYINGIIMVFKIILGFLIVCTVMIFCFAVCSILDESDQAALARTEVVSVALFLSFLFQFYNS